MTRMVFKYNYLKIFAVITLVILTHDYFFITSVAQFMF